MAASAFKLIPTFPSRRAGERPFDLGLRAFRFLLTEELSAAVLDTEDLEQALAASQSIVTGKDLSLEVRDRYQRLRLDIMTTVQRRQREARAAAAAQAAPAPAAPTVRPTGGGGQRVKLIPTMPKLSPSGAAARPF